jgi:drug/metabolite transporter (DMT)-like permease
VSDAPPGDAAASRAAMPDESAAGPSRAPSRLVVRLLIGVLCLIWGSTWLVIRGGLADVPPLTGAAARFLAAGALMALLAPALARKEGGVRPSWQLVATLGTLNIGISYAIIYWAETLLPSGLVCVLWSVFPLMLGALSHVWLPSERLVGRQWLGLVVGFGGITALFATDLRGLGPGAVPAGLILLLSPALAAVGNVIVKRGGAHTSSALLTRNGMLLGGVLLAAAAWAGERDAPMRLTGAAVGSILFLAVFGSVVAFGLYFWLLRHAPAYEMAQIAYITPVIALLLGATLGDEPVGATTVAGTALVLAGVALVLLGRRTAAPARPGGRR